MLFISTAKPTSVTSFLDSSMGVELRLDLSSPIDLSLIKGFLKSTSNVMLTLRKKSHGGNFNGSESEREALMEKLLQFEPPFFDLEYDMRQEFLEEIFKKYPKTKFILSYHNFEETPACLNEIYHAMQKYPAYSYKIATHAKSTNDALKLLLFVKKNPKVSGISLGEKGTFARVLGKIAGNLVNYASLNNEDATGPGQLTFKEMRDLYNYESLNEKSAIYGLVGDPVEQSPGHQFHNALFKKQNVNAVYVKMSLKQEELSKFIPLAKEMGFKGLSVTIPLKEKILPFVQEMTPIGAVNTLLFQGENILGINTDGVGCLDAIERKFLVQGKKVVILGAGGSARAIAYEAKKRGAHVFILNRTLKRAKKLADEIGCTVLEKMPLSYDVLINCSPDPMPIDSKEMRENALVMDIVYFPKETEFLKAAIQKNCQVVYGEEMFLNQAQRQNALWR